MAVLLIITTLDVAGRRNNREHHVITQMAPHFEGVVVVFRRRGIRGHLLRYGVETTVRGRVTYVAVNPMLNAPEGTVRGLSAGGTTRILGRILGRVLDVAGIARDWLTIRALARAARGVATPGMVVEAFGPWAAAAAERLRREGRIGRYAYIDRDYEPGFMATGLRQRWAARTEARAAARADLTLSIGHRLAARFGGVQVSPTGVDCGLFTPVLREVPVPHLIFVGQVAAWSGIEEVLAAMTLLSDVPGLRLTVLGPGEPAYVATLQARMAALGGRVDWRGDCTRDQVAAALATAGIGLATFRAHPLRIHAAPLKLLEYMASGLPVIALDGSEAGDMVTREGVGVTCATTGEAIAQAVRRLLGDPAGYAAMSRAGPAAAAGYDWSAVMARERGMLGRLYGLPWEAAA
jgi:glycosyltransferase involved in cell wall biosynthesis